MKMIFSYASICLLVGCATPAQHNYDQQTFREPIKVEPFQHKRTNDEPSFSPAKNFQARLFDWAFTCSLEQDLSYQVVRMYGKADPDREKRLSDCKNFAYQDVSEAINRLNNKEKDKTIIELSKDMYSKWSVYMGTMSSYSPKDRFSERKFEEARERLLTEEKFLGSH